MSNLKRKISSAFRNSASIAGVTAAIAFLQNFWLCPALLAAPASDAASVPTTSKGSAGAHDQKTKKILADIDQKILNARPTETQFQALGEIIGQDPSNAEAHLILGLCYEKISLPRQALQQYDQASKLAPTDPRPIIEMALTRIRIGETEDISGLIAHASSLFPNDPGVAFLVGYDALQHRRFALALKKFAYAYERQPNMPWLKACYAEALYDQQEIGQALRLALAELQTDPANWRANTVAGEALIDLDRYSDAVKYLTPACEYQKDRTDLNFRLAYFCVWKGDYNAAITPIVRYLAVASGPFSDTAKQQKLLLDSLRHANKATAMAAIDKVNQNFGFAQTNAYYRDDLGLALDSVGWHREAMDSYRAAIKIKPTYGLPVYNLAHDCESYGHDYEQARLLYKNAQQLGLPENISATDAVNRLDDRLAMRDRDMAWRLKDLLSRGPQ